MKTWQNRARRGGGAENETAKKGKAWLPPIWCWLEGMNLSLTPLLENKPNTVGKMRCEAEDAAVSMPPPPLLSLINPQHFPLVSARNQIPPPSVTNVLNSWTLTKPCVVSFVCHVNYWSVPKPWAQLLMPEKDSQNQVKNSLTVQ